MEKGLLNQSQMDVCAKRILNLILKINPLYYLVELFRDAFLGTNVSTLSYTVYFWIITLSLFIFSSKEFSRFRSEFDDVL